MTIEEDSSNRSLSMKEMFPNRLNRIRAYGKAIAIFTQLALADSSQDIRDFFDDEALVQRHDNRGVIASKRFAKWAVEKELCTPEARERYFNRNLVPIEERH